MDAEVSKDKCNSRWADQENLIHVRWNSIKNCHQNKKQSSMKKKAECSNASQKPKEEPIEFSRDITMQNEVLPSH